VDASFIRQKTLFGAIVGEQASLHHLILHLFIFFLTSNPYYLENHFVLSLFFYFVV
jgi:hypothetical protein